MKPREYTYEEGGFWMPWTGPDLADWQLERYRAMKAPEQPCVFIANNRVHALRFADGRIWDVINGFRDRK